jgi:transcriptional regulator with XRE-family HTH domain
MPLPAHFEAVLAASGKRREPRRTLRLEAVGARETGDAAEVLVHNVSATGLLLETHAELAVGEAIEIDLPHSGATSARVIWHSGDLFGCRFDESVSAATLSAAQLQSAVVDEPEMLVISGESFATRLQRLRKASGLSMADIAARLGVSKPTVWAWEQGRAKPVDERIAALAEALGVGPEELVAGRDVTAIDHVLARVREDVARAYGVRAEQVRIQIEL